MVEREDAAGEEEKRADWEPAARSITPRQPVVS